LIECQNKKPVIKQTTESKTGKALNPPGISIDGNVLSVDCESKAQELFATWKSNHTFETITEKVPYEVERDFTFFEKLFLVLGKILAVLIGFIGLGLLLKIKKILPL